MHGDGTGERRQHQQQVEHQREEVPHNGRAAKERAEDVGQRDEDEAGTGIRGHALHGEHGGEDDETAEDGHHRVDAHDVGRRLQEVHVALEIAGIGGETADGDGKGEEGLPQGGEHHVGGDLREVGLDEERHAVGRSGHGLRTDSQQEHEHGEHGHEDLGHAFDAAFHTADDDEVGDEQEEHGIEEGLPRRGGEGGEIGGRVERGLRVDECETPRDGIDGVFEDPPGHDAVVGEDEGDARHAGITGEAPGLAGRQTFVGRSDVRVGATADDELGGHHRYAEENDAGEIDDDEGCAAILTGFNGKTPDVAQSHGAACRGQDDADFRCKIAARFHDDDLLGG